MRIGLSHRILALDINIIKKYLRKSLLVWKRDRFVINIEIDQLTRIGINDQNDVHDHVTIPLNG